MNSKEFISTTNAARLLGLSVGTVQQMVEAGKLEAWKTQGGHRRIVKASLDKLLTHEQSFSHASDKLRVFVVEDDKVLLKAYDKLLKKLELPIDLFLFDNGLDAVLALGKGFPDVLLLDLEVPYVDGFEMLKRLESIKTDKAKHIIVISGQQQEMVIAKTKQYPTVTVLPKPANQAFLEGYLKALYVCKQ